MLRSIKETGADCRLLQADLGTMAGIRKLQNEIADCGFTVDVLVNNAGSLVARTKVLDFTPDLWETVMNLNLASAFFVAQAVLPHMVQQRRGWMVNVSSVAARTGGGIGASVYSAAKAGLSTLTKSLAKEFGPHGIYVNAVSPGTIETRYHAVFSTRAAQETVKAETLVGRLGTAQEIADTILYLCSSRASFIQGQVLEVNGGFLMA